MKAFVKKKSFLPYSRTISIDYGWGNGYVVIPKGHDLHGKDYNEIHELMPTLDVHYGLTFSCSADELDWAEIPKGSEGGWVVGFDTAHYNDNLQNWSKLNVFNEAKSLQRQIEEYTLLLDK